MIEFQTSANRTPAGSGDGHVSRNSLAISDGAELKTAQDYFQSGIGKRQAAVDLAWALMNSAEFLYRH